MSWLDGPFFDLISRFTGMTAYWHEQAMKIGYIVALFGFCWGALRWAFGGSFQKDIIKMVLSMVVALFLMSNYQSIMTGLTGLIFKWGYASTYTQGVEDMVNEFRNDSQFWDKKGEKFVSPGADDSGDPSLYPATYSDIIKEITVYYGSGVVGHRYVLNLFDDDTNFIRPNAIMRFVLLITERMKKQIDKLSLKELGTQLSIWVAMAGVLVSSILGVLQYVIGVVEFSLISAIGIIFVPFMIWDGTKFLTEKLIGCIIGFTVKMLIMTIALQIMTTGYIQLLRKDFNGQWDQIVYTVFITLMYTIFTQSAPSMAQSLLTGSPQLSLGEGLAAVGAYAAAGAGALAAGKAAGGASVTGLAQATGAISAAAGSAAGAYKAGGGAAGMAKAFGGSLVGSAGESLKSGAHGLAGSLIGRRPEENKFSRFQQYKNQNSMADMMGGGGSVNGMPDTGTQHRHSLYSYGKSRFNEAKEGYGAMKSGGLGVGHSGNTENERIVKSSGEAVPFVEPRQPQQNKLAPPNRMALEYNNTKALPNSDYVYGAEGSSQFISQRAKHEGVN